MKTSTAFGNFRLFFSDSLSQHSAAAE